MKYKCTIEIYQCISVALSYATQTHGDNLQTERKKK